MNVSPEQWPRVRAIFEAALPLNGGARAAYVENACRDDSNLRRQVETLLASHDQAATSLEAPVGSLVTREDDDLAGRVTGSYRIEARIGTGGMGEVYRAHDTKLDRPVALKLLSSAVARDPERLRRFRAEARAASSLNHPHIVIIHDFGEIDERPFIITELVEGHTLRQRLESGPLPVREALAVVTQVASALSAAHARGIVHRDIKPENIMVRPDGYVKVLDFGLAKLTVEDSASAQSLHCTEPGMVLGTPRYMSPEQARGLETSPTTDVWSVGVVLYELLAGRPPFTGPTTADMMAAILNQQPPRLDAEAPHVPQTLARIVSKALEKDASARYASASELHAALLSSRENTDSGVYDVRTGDSSHLTAQHTVGREKEHAELLAAFRRAAAGQGHLLSISGDAGTGKTTLVESFLDSLSTSSSPCLIGRGRCSERLAGSEAYLPVLEALESLLASNPAVIGRQMADVAPTWYSQVATVTPASGVAARAAESQAGSQERLKREVAALVRELSRAEPLVLFFDDVHWADASTIDLLAYLAPRFAELRVLIVVTSRPSDLLLANHPFVSLRRDLQSRRLCHEVALGLLTEADITRYFGLEFPGHAFPSDLPRLIHAKTEGNPLFMADLVRYLRGSGTLLQEDDGRWVVVGALDTIGRELPESVRGMIERKIAQLTDEDRALLTAASVQGYEFDSAVVAKVLNQDAVRVEERLEVLERAHRFVQLVEEREFPDRTLTGRYRFVHVLYQNALFAQLRATRRATLSAAVAEALLRLHATRDREIASELAALYQAARDYAQAAHYCGVAAQQAVQLFASREAVVLASRGVSLLQSEPQTPHRQEQELALYVILGNALIATRGYAADEVLETYTRARGLCAELGDTEHFAAVLYGFAALWLVRGHHHTSLQYARELLELTERRQDPAMVVAHRLVGWALLAMGQLEAACEQFETVRTMYVAEQHSVLAYSYGHEPGMSSRINLALTFWLLGKNDDATRCRNEALELARRIPHANSQCYAFTFAAMHDQLQGDRASARANAEAALKLAEEQGLKLWLGWSAIMRGWAMIADGDVADGAAEMRRGIDAAKSTGASLLHTCYLVVLAETLLEQSALGEAIATLDEAEELMQRHDERFWESELLRVRAELARRGGDKTSAVELLNRAIAIAGDQKAESLRRRSLALLEQLTQP